MADRAQAKAREERFFLLFIQMWIRVQPHGYIQQPVCVSAETDEVNNDCADKCSY